MSETNGQGESRLDRVEASHVKLMTDHALFVKEQELAWQKQRESWERHEEFMREYNLKLIDDRARGAALDDRIDKLVSAVGELIRRSTP